MATSFTIQIRDDKLTPKGKEVKMPDVAAIIDGRIIDCKKGSDLTYVNGTCITICLPEFVIVDGKITKNAREYACNNADLLLSGKYSIFEYSCPINDDLKFVFQIQSVKKWSTCAIVCYVTDADQTLQNVLH